MKRATKTILYMSCILLLTVANCFAFAVVGDAEFVTMDKGTYRPAGFPGGEFKLKTDLNESYAAFCVEYEESMNFADTFRIDSVRNYANEGGGGDNGARWVNGEWRDRLSKKTKWLMNEYVNGGLKKDYSSYGKDLGGAMQLAIWDFEDEDYGNRYGDYKDLAKELKDLAVEAVVGLDYALFKNVKVVNLRTLQGGYVQSQIIAAPVPEPATMLLIGTGLIGIAGFGRRKLKK